MPPTVEAASGYKVIATEFGLFDVHDGKDVFTPTTHVPLRVGQAYGWLMILRTSKEKITWREEFTLPEPPKTWEISETEGKRSISDDQRTAVTERTVTPDRGVLMNSWSVVEGDPVGRYQIRVFIERVLVKEIAFDVE